MKKNYNTHIIAYHGWGFNASFWDPLKKCLNSDIFFEAADRGYFSSSNNPDFNSSTAENKIIVTHSFGLHWCPDEVLNSADHLVIMGGYLNFHPPEKDEYRRSKMNLRQMLSQFIERPQFVLKQFYGNSLAPQKNDIEVPDSMNHDLLLSDLSRIDRDQQSHQRIFDCNSIVILHGAEDLVVHKSIARDMYHSLRYRSQYFEILNAGHAFPLTHSEKNIEILSSLFKPKLVK